MTLVNDDMSKILEYLARGDQDASEINLKGNKMDGYHHDGILNDPWSASDDLLEKMFSLEEGSLNFLEESMPDFNLNVENTTQPPDIPGSSSSDSGLSSDQAEYDFEQQLSPFLIQNSCDEDLVNSAILEAGSPNDMQHVIQDGSLMSSCSSDSVEEEPFNLLDFEQNVVPGFINDTFQSPGKVNRKRRLSQTPQVLVQSKMQRPAIKVTSSGPGVKPQLVVKSQPQKPIKLTNIQVINPPTKVYSRPAEHLSHRKVIRVAPMAGNSRSILLPVTIKDMKDLKSIKIINAADLKHASNIKLAAANLLSQSKLQDLKVESTSNMEFDYDHSGANCEESGSERSDDDDAMDVATSGPGRAGYPRLVLTAEERRLLAKEGVSLPASYPLTKHEERELKRIRRKIRNKISAQDSRKRKKEYVDGLEDRVKQCTADNQTLIRRIKILQTQNQSLTTQLKRLQSVLTGSASNTASSGNSATYGSGSMGKATPPATCLLVLLLSVALVALPSLREEAPPPHRAALASPAASAAPASPALRRALLSLTHKISREETVIDDGEFNMDDLLTLNRPHFDHDYQVVKGAEPRRTLPVGYVDMPIDEDWPPDIKKLKLEFDYGDGRDYIPPIVKEENYENFGNYKLDSKIENFADNLELMIDKKFDSNFFKNSLISAGRKLGELMDLIPPIPVHSEDLVIEEVHDHEIRNITDIKHFVINNTMSDI